MNDKWEIIRSWLALVIAMLSIVLSTLIFLYTFQTHEYGLLFGSKKCSIKTLDSISLNNIFFGLQIKLPNLTIYNEGTLRTRIHRIEGFIKFGDEKKIFKTTNSFSVAPNDILSADLILDQKLLDKQTRLERSLIGVEAARDLLIKYQKMLDNNKPILLSQPIHSKMKDAYESNVKWMTADSNYYLLLLFWINGDTDADLRKVLYKFDVDKQIIEYLRDYPIDAAKTPDYLKNNQYMQFTASFDLKEITDEKMIENVYKSYTLLSVE